ncbi:MAG: DUF3604 domain-containing protein [Microcoleaceae cyanobacterium]
MNWNSLKSLIHRFLPPVTTTFLLVVITIFTAHRAISQSTVLAQLPAGEYDNPELLEQGSTVVPNYGYSPYSGGREFPQRVYWGDTHLHTVYSFDAGTAGTRLTPEDAYRFDRGEEVKTNTGQLIRLSRPMDFLVVTDHTDGLGAFSKLLAGTPEILADPQANAWHEAVNEGGEAAAQAQVELVQAFSQGTLSEAVLPTVDDFKNAWEEEIDVAEAYNDPGVFTAVIGYEWTSVPGGNNLHRNVIYRDNGDKARQMLPQTTQQSTDPESLWDWMQNYEDKTGGNVLAIPHNGNLSSGLMFADTTHSGGPLTEEYAKRRQLREPLYEIIQMKGASETHPILSTVDEFADFEVAGWDNGNLDLSVVNEDEMLQGEYIRAALKQGLKFEEELGTNPFKYGFAAGSDTHTALSSIEENNYSGKFPAYEPSPERATHISKQNEELNLIRYGWQYGAAGWVGVWARENTREALFDAMERREVYATSGPRMTVRFFGGWNFTQDDTGRNPGDVGYAKGVPMGSDIKNAPAGKAPSFLVGAVKDPIRGNLDRIQIIKGWLEASGETQEKVYDVVWSDDRKPGADCKLPPVGNTVNTDTAEWKNTIGATELVTVWADPDFDPTQRAFYYARVLEIPTPRWTDYDEVFFKENLPEEIPLSIQERCYTSPIWYSPA